jgi:hypothetical protein
MTTVVFVARWKLNLVSERPSPSNTSEMVGDFLQV